MNWNVYVTRRKINVNQWLSTRGIKTPEAFMKELTRIGLECPNQDQISQMFPTVEEKPPNEEIDEPTTISPEGSDKTATWGVVSEGNRSDQRSDRKRSSKVRG